MTDDKNGNIEQLREKVIALVQKRDELHVRQKQLIDDRRQAINIGHATSVLSIGSDLKQISDDVLTVCAEIDSALADFESAKDALFMRDNLAAHGKAKELGDRIRTLREELTPLEQERELEIKRIQPRVDDIAQAKQSREKFIADTKASSAYIVQTIVTI